MVGGFLLSCAEDKEGDSPLVTEQEVTVNFILTCPLTN